eukprot:82252-Chlamydomonas_euryale.AAC.2
MSGFAFNCLCSSPCFVRGHNIRRVMRAAVLVGTNLGHVWIPTPPLVPHSGRSGNGPSHVLTGPWECCEMTEDEIVVG